MKTLLAFLGRHHQGCTINRFSDVPRRCSCGRDKAMQELRDLLARSGDDYRQPSPDKAMLQRDPASPVTVRAVTEKDQSQCFDTAQHKCPDVDRDQPVGHSTGEVTCDSASVPPPGTVTPVESQPVRSR